MQWIVAAAMLLIPVGGPFVDAAARAEPVGESMEVELVVEVDRPAAAVIAHLIVGGDEPQRSVTLDGRTERIYGGFVTLPIQDSVVVFELIGSGGFLLSDATTLTEMGLDFGALSGADRFTVVTDAGSAASSSSQRWLWLAVAAGAAALAALGLWVRAGDGFDEPDDDDHAEPEASGASTEST